MSSTIIQSKTRFFLPLLLALLVLAGGGLVAYGQSAPTLTVNPLVKFEQGKAPILVAPNLTLVGLVELERATVSLNANFRSNEDQLGMTGNYTNTTIVWEYHADTGILTLSGTDTLANYQAALQQVTYNNSSGTPTLADRTVSISIGSSLYYEGTKHYYEYVPAANISWTGAKSAAEAKSYYGLQGYLVTVTSEGENNFIASKLQGNGWMGATDTEHDKEWKWVTGPETGNPFFHQKGYNPAGASACDATIKNIGPDANQPINSYNNWALDEPNDVGSNGTLGCASGEDYAHFFKSGQWNDFPNDPKAERPNYPIFADGYVIEYGGMPNDPTLALSGEVTIELVAATDGATKIISVCSQDSTTYNILGSNAASLRAKLTNPANFGPKGAYGNYEFKFVDVGDNFTQDILAQQCQIWYTGYETGASYTPDEQAALQGWVTANNGQVVAGCDDADHDPICKMLGFSVTTGTDTYGFAADTGGVNQIDCNGALQSSDQLNMAGGAGGHFTNVEQQYVLAVHEVNGAADATQPIVVYTGNYFLTSDINMIQTGSPADPTLTDGDEVTSNNDILAVNAFSALADASVGVEVCSSAKKVGTLKVYSSSSAVSTSTSTTSTVLLGDTTVELILDASGSMNEPLMDSNGTTSTRIAIAKQVLNEVVDTALPDNLPVALRAYGTEEGCSSHLLVPPAPLDRNTLKQTIADIQLKGWTPIAASLEAVQQDLENVPGPKLVVLVTDGEENCSPTPEAYDPNAPLTAIVKLREAGIDVRINIVGFAIDNQALHDQFEQWARAGGGEYYNATDPQALDESIRKALSIPYRVTNDQGKEVATGVIDGPPLELPEGSYFVEILTDPIVRLPVTIHSQIEMGIGVIR